MFRRMKKMFKDEEGSAIVGSVAGLAPSAVFGLPCGGVLTTFITALCVMFSGACDIWTIGTSICCLGCGTGIVTGIYGLCVGAVSACSICIIDLLSCFGLPAFAMTLCGACGICLDYCCCCFIPSAILCLLPVCGLGITGLLACVMPCLAPLGVCLTPIAALIAMILAACGFGCGTGIFTPVTAALGSIGSIGQVLAGGK